MDSGFALRVPRNDKGTAVFGLKDSKSKAQKPPVPEDFQRALTQQVMATDLLRIKVLMVTALLLGVTVGIVYFVAPGAVNSVWHGKLTPS